MSKFGTFSTKSQKGGGGFQRKKRFNLEEGSNLYRILPPFGTLAEVGKIAQYWSVTWVPGSDGKVRPVPSIKRKKNNQVIQNDPLEDKVEALKKNLDVLVKNGESKEVVDKIAEKVRQLSPDKGYYLNVLTPGGEMGVLKIRYTAYQSLLSKLEELEREGVDPINTGIGNGLFFDFKKTKDERGRVVYSVDIGKKTYKDPSGRLISEYLQSEIDDNTLKRMEKESEDLTKLYRVLDAEEVALIATLDGKTIDRVFQRPQQNEAPDSGDGHDDGSGEEDVDVVAAATATVKASNKPQESSKQSSQGGADKEKAAATKQQASSYDEDYVSKFLQGN